MAIKILMWTSTFLFHFHPIFAWQQKAIYMYKRVMTYILNYGQC